MTKETYDPILREQEEEEVRKELEENARITNEDVDIDYLRFIDEEKWNDYCYKKDQEEKKMLKTRKKAKRK